MKNKFIKKSLTVEEVFNELVKICKEKNTQEFSFLKYSKIHTFDQYKNYMQKTHYNYSKVNKRNVSDFSIEKELTKLHQSLESPIVFIHEDYSSASISNKEYYINIPLKYLGIKDTFGSVEQLTQEIEYCLTNVINNKNEPPIAINDKVKLLEHGFDLKKSFRHRT